ncbi:MAG TPA: phage tail protein [Chitinophagaceae bacterium]|nr:phage tail protein [Chitinophagaceae bacterium]
MAGETQNNTWPLPKFYFSVDMGASLANIAFQEVTGLDTETQPIEYRNADSAAFSTIKMPGIAKYGNVTMKKGIFVNDNTFWQWYNQVKMNTLTRATITIRLLDQTGNTTMQWILNNAFPVKITGTDMKSDGNEVAIESVEIAYKTLVIATPGS